jgi:hypothetical protein
MLDDEPKSTASELVDFIFYGEVIPAGLERPPARNAMRGVRTHASRNGVIRLIQVPPQKSVPD